MACRMIRKPHLSPHAIAAAATALAGGLTMAAPAAHAATATTAFAVSMSSAMPLAAIGAAQTACGTLNPVTTIAAPAAPSGLPSFSKSSAILGGQVSALEKMRMQQGGAPAETTAAQSFAGALPAASASLPIAAVGFGCGATIAAPDSGSEAQTNATGAFLGTERVKIGKTRFDREWKRVARKTLSRADLSAAIGGVPAERPALLGQVNSWVNRSITYRGDVGGDKWADAKSTLRTRKGDCEDYAILKMQMLAAAGVMREDMMLTLARDTMRRVDHAVLLVKDGGQWVMLDMQSDRVAPAGADYGYKPVMSFAGNGSFLHGKRHSPENAAAGAARLARLD